MTKWFSSLLLLSSSILTATVFAWSSPEYKPLFIQTTSDQPTPGFNLQDNRRWFLEADYLFWKPQMENCNFAIKTTDLDDPNIVGKIKQPTFDLSSGVRVGVGAYNGDRWDIGLKGTYLYSDATKHVTANPARQTMTIPEWAGIIFGIDGVKATNHWRMNFGLLDFSLGREFFLTKRFSVHPFIGLRGAIINQKNNSNYLANFTLSTGPGVSTIVQRTSHFSAQNNIWGVGPRVGVDLNFYISKSWSFLGGLAGSLLYARYHVDEKFNGFFISTDTQTDTSTINPVNVRITDSTNFGRANLDAYFGLGWDHWYNDGKNRVAIAIAFEAQQWFNLNQWFIIDVTNSDGQLVGLRADKNHGDLSLIGGTVHLQVDF